MHAMLQGSEGLINCHQNLMETPDDVANHHHVNISRLQTCCCIPCIVLHISTTTRYPQSCLPQRFRRSLRASTPSMPSYRPPRSTADTSIESKRATSTKHTNSYEQSRTDMSSLTTGPLPPISSRMALSCCSKPAKAVPAPIYAHT